MTPREAKTHKQIEKLPRDNWAWGDYWMMLDGGRVLIAKQRIGHSPEASIALPRRVFEHFIDAYNGVLLTRTRRPAKRSGKSA